MKLVRLSKVILNKFLDIFVVFHFLSIKNLKLEYHDCECKDLTNFCRQQTEISSNTMQYLQKYPEFRKNVIGKFCRKKINSFEEKEIYNFKKKNIFVDLPSIDICSGGFQKKFAPISKLSTINNLEQ